MADRRYHIVDETGTAVRETDSPDEARRWERRDGYTINDATADEESDATTQDPPAPMGGEGGPSSPDEPLDVSCAYCDAKVGEPCHTESGAEKTGYHKARREAVED